MKQTTSPLSRRGRLPIFLRISLPLVLVFALAAIGLMPRASASSSSTPSAKRQDIRPLAGDTCVAATVINPGALPYFDEATNAGAGNDIDPGAGACAPGPGADVVYAFTPSATDSYTVGATPLGSTFDPSLYIITDCANPVSSCVAGTNARPFGKGETLTVTLNAGTRYFIVVDNAQ